MQPHLSGRQRVKFVGKNHCGENLCSQVQLSPELFDHFQGDTVFDQIFSIDGELFRKFNNRKTLRFVCDGKRYFLKIHRGVGWKEIFKNLVQLRWPVISAGTEWRAIRRLQNLGIESMTIAGYGQRDWNPASRQSFLITEELENTVSLEHYCRDWPNSPPPFALKYALIDKIAEIAKRLHENGVCHRDFYLCHFLVDRLSLRRPFHSNRLRVFLIDLHRAQLRQRMNRRWIVKDLAGLFFSSMDIGLSRQDYFHFMTAYRGKPLRDIMNQETRFWFRVMQCAIALYRKTFGRSPQCALLSKTSKDVHSVGKPGTVSASFVNRTLDINR